MENPIVTIIIRNFNRAHTLKIAINSAMKQTVDPKKYSILVVDDGSTDASKALLEQYSNHLQIHYSNHIGPIRILNKGLSKIYTPYFMILDSDDFFDSAMLETMLEELKPGSGITYCDYFEWNKSTNKQKKVVIGENIFNTLASGVLLPTLEVKRVGGYDQKLFFPEYDLLLKLKHLPKRYLPVPLFTYCRHNNALTSNKHQVELGGRQLEAKYGYRLPIRKY